MNWVLKRFRVVISIALVLSTIITYLIVYIPRRNALEHNALNNFTLVASANEHTFYKSIEYAMTITEEISDNDSLKNLIHSYKQGLTSYDTLKTETQEFFSQFVQTIPFIVGSLRFADNMLISSQGTVDYSKITAPEVVDGVRYEVECVDFVITVYSPIYYGDNAIGLDITVFDLSESIKTLHDGNFDFSLFDLTKVENGGRRQKTLNLDGIELIDDGEYIYYRSRINDSNFAFQVAVKRDVLFSSTRKITVSSLISAVLGNMTLLLLTNFIVIQIAGHRFKHIERRKDLYKEYAYKDALTGAQSRLYLERWIYAHSNDPGLTQKNICVVMLDINNYKLLNDTMGHCIGDKVLQYIVRYVKNSIKKDDFIVRYGGDEFIIILLDTELQEAESILATIEEKLSSIVELKLGVSIAYGIEQVSSYDDIFDAIEKADRKMYISKDKYKQMLLKSSN
jgi:diguanylate cyclase (GGDEF)-like protein